MNTEDKLHIIDKCMNRMVDIGAHGEVGNVAGKLQTVIDRQLKDPKVEREFIRRLYKELSLKATL